jgi:hypothetical protein
MSENTAEPLFISISNLKFDSPRTIDLGDCRIRPLEEIDEDIRQAIMLGLGSPHDFRYPMPRCDYVLETTGTLRELESLVMRTLAVFRLFKDAQIVCEQIVVGRPPRGGVSFRHLIPWSRVEILPYCVKQNEQRDFAEFWKGMAGLDSKNFAVYRFTLADFRPYLYDRFTDHVESMEYLFVPDSGEGEIRYKFMSRGALILGRYEAGSKRLQIYEEMKDAYDTRSAIVHGTVPDESRLRLGESKFDRWEDANQLLRQYNRETIMFFFRRACLGDRDKRTELLKRMLISDSRIVE